MALGTIPKPAVARLCSLYQLLGDLGLSGTTRVSSAELGTYLGVGPHNLRKDISYLGVTGSSGGAYSVEALRKLLGMRLGLGTARNACVVGLGRIGSAILEHSHLIASEFVIAAGFDSSINLLETIRTNVPVFPAFELERVVCEKSITLGIIAVPPSSAQETADRLAVSGVGGIVNFAPVVVRPPRPDIHVRNMDIVGELRFLTAMAFVGAQQGDSQAKQG